MAGLPEIFLSLEDRELLEEALEIALRTGRYDAAIFLANEIHRARPVPAAELPQDCMRLTARGRYRDEQSGVTRDAILVLPGHERRSMGLISVLDEIGTALLGLRAGRACTGEADSAATVPSASWKWCSSGHRRRAPERRADGPAAGRHS